MELAVSEQPIISADFPPILEHDVAEQMAAIVSGATLNGNATAGTIDRETLARLVLQALAVDNIEEVIARLQVEWDEMDAAEEDRAAAMATAVTKGLSQDKQVPATPAVQEAVRGLAVELERFRVNLHAAGNGKSKK